MPIVDNIIGIVRGINDRKRASRVDDALGNYMNDPQMGMGQIIDADPRFALQFQQQQAEQQRAADKAARERAKANTDLMSRYLRGAKPGSDYGALIDQQTPFFKSTGVGDDEIAAFRQAVTANPDILAGLDDESYKTMTKDRYGNTVLTPGSIALRGGEVAARAPFAPKQYTLRSADGNQSSYVFDPNAYVEEAEVAPRRGVDPTGPAAAPPGGGLGDDEAGQILGDALQNKVIGQSDARVIRDALGPNGGARYNQWLKENGIRVVPDGVAARAPASPSARQAPRGDLSQPIAQTTGVKPQKHFRPATPEELRGYPPGTAAQINPETGELKNLKTPPAASQPKPLTLKDRTTLEKQVTQAEDLVSSMDRLEATARRLMDHPGADAATGMIAGRLPGVGQQATNFINDFNNLKQVVGLEAMKALKALSASGATGFGNMSNAEGTRIENMLGSLERTSDLPSLRRVYQQIIDFAREKKAGARRGIASTRQTLQGEGGASSAPTRPAIGAGTIIRDKKTGRKAILDNTGWVWMDTGEPVGGKKK